MQPKKIATVIRTRSLTWCDAANGITGGYCNRCGHKAHRPITGAIVAENDRINETLRGLIRGVK